MTNTATNANDSYETRPPSAREQPTTRELQQRRDRVRKIVIATRAALHQFRIELERSMAKTSARLDALEAWADGGELPAFVDQYADALHHVDSAAPCECGRCKTCKAYSVLADSYGVLDIEDGAAVACRAAMGEIDKSSLLDRVGAQLSQNLIPQAASTAVRSATRQALRAMRGAA